MLAPLHADWPNIDATRKRKWIEIADRYPNLPPDEQKRIAARMTEWAHLTPTERAQARLHYQEAKQLSPQQRQERWQAYQALPEDQKKALQARATPAPPHAAAASRPPAAKAHGAGAPPVKAVAPSLVQAQPGATTTLMNHKPARQLALRPGAPKIAAPPGQVDPATLLPQTGPQAAARAAPGSASR